MDDKILLNHAEDLARKAAKKGFAASKFLSPAEAETIRQYFANRKDVTVAFDGGFPSAERVIAVFSNPDWGEYDRGGLLTALRISHRPQDTIGHRDVLGALMNLGIVRETVGDISVDPAPAVLVCLSEIAEFILQNLTRIGRVGVTAAQIPLSSLPEKEENIEVKSITVPSLRLDAVISGAFNISRTTAAEAITAGRVALNHAECLKPDKELTEGALFSVRGIGRARILAVGGKSRKDRLRVDVGIYM